MSDLAFRIFVSYAPEDTELKDQLVAHLAFLQRSGRVTIWHDEMIGAGEERQTRIRRELADSQIVLLLVSPDFIDSDIIHDHELKDALLRHEEGTARVIPVILRRCHFEGLPFSRLQAVPRFAEPVTSHADRDVVLAEIAAAVGDVVEELSSGQTDIGRSPGATQRTAPDDTTHVYFLAHPDDTEYSARIRDKIHPAVLTSPLGIELIDHWNLPPGAVTSEQIGRADIVVLVISGRMLTSPRVSDPYRQVVEMYERDSVTVVLVQARRFMLTGSRFENVPVFPSADVALIDLNAGQQDEAVFQIAHALTVAIYGHRMAREGLLVPTQRYRSPSTGRSSSAGSPPVDPPRRTDTFDFLVEARRPG